MSKTESCRVKSKSNRVNNSISQLHYPLHYRHTTMSTKDNTGLTPTGTPTVNQTKRLSTIKTPGSPKTLKTGGGGVKDVVSPGELCGFVCLSPRTYFIITTTTS